MTRRHPYDPDDGGVRRSLQRARADPAPRRRSWWPLLILPLLVALALAAGWLYGTAT